MPHYPWVEIRTKKKKEERELELKSSAPNHIMVSRMNIYCCFTSPILWWIVQKHIKNKYIMFFVCWKRYIYISNSFISTHSSFFLLSFSFYLKQKFEYTQSNDFFWLFFLAWFLAFYLSFESINILVNLKFFFISKAQQKQHNLPKASLFSLFFFNFWEERISISL